MGKQSELIMLEPGSWWRRDLPSWNECALTRVLKRLKKQRDARREAFWRIQAIASLIETELARRGSEVAPEEVQK